MYNYILDTISQIAVHVAPSRVEVSGDDRLPTRSICCCDGTGWSVSMLGTMRSMSVYRTLFLVTTLEVSVYALPPIEANYRGQRVENKNSLGHPWGRQINNITECACSSLHQLST